MPYRLRLSVQVRQCIRPWLVEAVAGGDVSSRGMLRLEAVGDGTSAEVTLVAGDAQRTPAGGRAGRVSADVLGS